MTIRNHRKGHTGRGSRGAASEWTPERVLELIYLSLKIIALAASIIWGCLNVSERSSQAVDDNQLFIPSPTEARNAAAFARELAAQLRGVLKPDSTGLFTDMDMTIKLI